jgi:hypothetical protein
MSTELPQAFTGTVTGTWTSLPERTPAESLAVPSACVSAKAELPHRDRMLVAAAAATTPLLRVCRNLVVFLLEEVGKADLGTWSGCPRPARIRPYGRGVARSLRSCLDDGRNRASTAGTARTMTGRLQTRDRRRKKLTNARRGGIHSNAFTESTLRVHRQGPLERERFARAMEKQFPERRKSTPDGPPVKGGRAIRRR